tara:strand:+ start:319 stop:519 length:201 start_codon:yes stop_codon:yes gene_type:complete
MDKNLRKELINLVDQYDLTIFERARILYQARGLWNRFIICDNVKETNYLSIIFNQAKKDCLEVKNG